MATRRPPSSRPGNTSPLRTVVPPGMDEVEPRIRARIGGGDIRVRSVTVKSLMGQRLAWFDALTIVHRSARTHDEGAGRTGTCRMGQRQKWGRGRDEPGPHIVHVAPELLVRFVTMSVVRTRCRDLRLVQMGIHLSGSLPERSASCKCWHPWLASWSLAVRLTAHHLRSLASRWTRGQHGRVQEGDGNRPSPDSAEHQSDDCQFPGRS